MEYNYKLIAGLIAGIVLIVAAIITLIVLIILQFAFNYSIFFNVKNDKIINNDKIVNNDGLTKKFKEYPYKLMIVKTTETKTDTNYKLILIIPDLLSTDTVELISIPPNGIKEDKAVITGTKTNEPLIYHMNTRFVYSLQDIGINDASPLYKFYKKFTLNEFGLKSGIKIIIKSPRLESTQTIVLPVNVLPTPTFRLLDGMGKDFAYDSNGNPITFLHHPYLERDFLITNIPNLV